MPLIVDDFSAASAVEAPVATPANFHSDLTGNGTGRKGRINVDVHPANPDTAYEPVPQTMGPRKDPLDSETTVRTLVTQPILERTLYTAINQVYAKRAVAGAHPAALLPVDVAPALVDRTIGGGKSAKTVTSLAMFDVTGALVGAKNGFTPSHRIWLDLEPQLVALRKRGVMQPNGDTQWTNTTHVRYRATFYVIDQASNTTPLVDLDGKPVTDASGAQMFGPDLDRVGAVTSITGQRPLSTGVDSFALVAWTADVPSMLDELVPELLAYLYGASAARGARVEIEQFQDWSVDHYDLYGRLCDAALTFVTEGATEAITELITSVHDLLGPVMALVPSEEIVQVLTHQLAFLDHFTTIPLEGYSTMHEAIVATDGGGPFSHKLINANVQLKQNAELQALAAIKDDLPTPGPIDPARWSLDPRYSAQQRAAICTDEPLVMVVAGAGAGKSTVVTERIARLTRGAGVDPSTIQVWSFTNAAADEIRDRNPGIVSKTIALTIHEIYSTNFPEQQLSTMETISNSIKIYFGDVAATDPIFQEFLSRIDALTVRGGENNANIIRLNTFVEQHLDAVISILETIKQTTLEFEIILSYLLIEREDFFEPNPSPDYLIIDEVQDNSAFQFVYAMRYATKHKCSLYLVGDASQTLYEFRAANPKALTALEASGVFEICKLSTNYRSTQEILDFANIHLAQIEANRFAQIQLDANDLRESTAQSFTDSVSMIDVGARTQAEFNESVGSYFTKPDVVEYIKANLRRGEVTTVLALTRQHCQAIQKTLERHFPDEHVSNLTSEQAFTSTTFSSYVAKYWDEITCVDPKVAVWTFIRQVDAHLGEFEKNLKVVRPIITDQLNDWRVQKERPIGLLLGQLDAGVITSEQFFLGLRQTILDYEVENNYVRSSLLKRKNLARKEAEAALDPKLMVSTVHGVKGMEFDNVILVLKPETAQIWKDEAYRRTLYVALTRAKSSELILAGYTSVRSRISGAYDIVVEALGERDAERDAEIAAASLLSGDEIAEGDVVDEEAAAVEETSPAPVADMAPVAIVSEVEGAEALGEFVLPEGL